MADDSFPADSVPARREGPAIDRFVGNLACAWVEDLMTDEAVAWAGARAAPTLLIDVDPAIGLTRKMVERLVTWAKSVSLSSPRTAARAEAVGDDGA